MARRTLACIIAFSLMLSGMAPAYARAASLFITDVKQGSFGTILVNGTPDADLSVVMVSPKNERSSVTVRTGKDGKASKKFDAPRTVGKYVAYISGLKEAAKTEFYVLSARQASAEHTRLELSSKRAFADGEDAIRISALVRDERSGMMEGRDVRLESANSSIRITPDTVSTDEIGEAEFRVTSVKAGTATLTLVDKATAVKLGNVKVEFLPMETEFSYGSAPASMPAMPYYPYPIMYPQYPMYPMYPQYPYQEPAGDLGSLQRKLQDLEMKLRNVGGSSRGGDYVGASILDVRRAYGQTMVDRFEFADLDTGRISLGQPASFTVRALDAAGNLVENYTGTVTFSSTDLDTLLPGDYQFEPADLGEHEFTLALTVLNEGRQKITVADVEDQDIKGEIEITIGRSQTVSPSAVNTITLASPVAGTYGSTLQTVSGVTRENSTVTIYHNSSVAGSVQTDTRGNFSFQITNLSEGKHTFAIESEHIPTGEITDSTPVEIVIDLTPPVITSVTLTPATVEESDPFLITVVTEQDATVEAMINNLIYDLTPHNGNYIANIIAPPVAGEYQVSLMARDRLGNQGNYPNEAVLAVKPKKRPITNVLAIGGEESVQLTWDLFFNAVRYQISYGTMSGNYTQQVVTLDSAPSWRLANLQGGTVYYIRIEALDASGQVISLPSQEVSVRSQERQVPDQFSATVIQPPNGGQVSSTGPELWLVLFGSLLFLDMYVRVRRKLKQHI